MSVLQAILACKMYNSSTRKHKILSAYEDPINSELVKQLGEYITDDRFKPEETVDPGKPIDTPKSEEHIIDNEGGGASGGSSGGSFADGGEFTGDNLPGEMHLSEDSDSEGSDNATDSGDNSLSSDNLANDNGSSEDIGDIAESTSIQASSCVRDIKSLSETLQGQLNTREDTQGVTRILEKEHELWIYYNDNTNLNNVMQSVIDVVNALALKLLSFSRLARSDNAMVFDIIPTNSQDVEPLSHEGGSSEEE